MNLQAANKELESRAPRVSAPMLAGEALVIFVVSFVLVGLFA